MTLPSSRRCFLCDKTFPSTGTTPLQRCPSDGSPLAPPLVGRRWRIDGVLAPRPGGGVYSASHVITGARGALTLALEPSNREMEEALQAEVQAQRMLEPLPGLLKVLEVGKDRDGARFYVSELRDEQLLSEILKEWHRPDDAAELFLQASWILRPLLRLLVAAHRSGVAHGALNATQVFAYSGDAALGEAPALSKPRLYGLRRLGSGPALVAAMRSDVTALGQLLHEILLGQPARLPLPQAQQESLRRRFGTESGNFVLAALGVAPSAEQPALASAEEMLGALSALCGEASNPGLLPDEAACEPVDATVERTDQMAAPSRMSLARRAQAADPPTVDLAAAPVAEPLAALPEVELPRIDPSHRYRLSGELHISCDDLLALAPVDSDVQIVARSRHRDASSIPPAMARIVPKFASAVSAPEVAIEVVSAVDSTFPGDAARPSQPPAVVPAVFEEATQPLASGHLRRELLSGADPRRESEAAPLPGPTDAGKSSSVPAVLLRKSLPAPEARRQLVRMSVWLWTVLLPVSMALMGVLFWLSTR